MSVVRAGVVVLVALVLQVGLLSSFSFEGARPDVLLLVAVAAGYAAGPDKGAVVGFGAGLAFDVVLTTPFGLSALVYTVVGYGVGALSGSVVRIAWWIEPFVVAAASAVGVVVYALVGEVVGQATLQGPSLAAIVVVVSAVNAVLAPLAVRALRWARTDDVDRRRHPYFAR